MGPEPQGALYESAPRSRAELDSDLGLGGREHLSDIQRARMLSAMVEAVAERGVGNVTVAHVVGRSGVSRRTFYELFEDREECFLVAFEEAVRQAATVVTPAYERPGSWQVKTRRALTALLQFLDFEPDTARLLVVEALGAGPRALQRRQNVLIQIIKIVDRGRAEAKKRDNPPPLTAEGVVGAALSIVHTRMVEEGSPPLVYLANELTSMIVLPYLGQAASRRELKSPTPRSVRAPSGGSANPLKNLQMRLTYRTVRVLMAVGAQPGVSNRRVADAAGVSDQGQISKLLARLDSLGLIENSGFGQAKGESNSWFLTERGREIVGAIQEQTSERA
jgi:AcrR family transcriptional regulator/DNA-binding MarR family transcriptional regulator